MTVNRIRPWALAFIGLALYYGASGATSHLLDLFSLEAGSGLRRSWFEVVDTILEFGLLGGALVALHPRHHINMRWTRPTLAWLALSVSIAALFLGLHWLLTLSWPQGWGITADILAFPRRTSDVGFVIYGMVACVLSPLSQELYFRGWILSATERIHPYVGIVVSALLFAFVDSRTGFGGAYTFLFGLIYAVTALGSRSVFVPAFIHVLVNTATAAMYLSSKPL